MKKSKFYKLAPSDKVIFEDEGSSKIGDVVRLEGDSAIVRTGKGEESIRRERIMESLKKKKWFPVGKIPPDNKLILLEDKTGAIKMGKRLEPKEIEFYDLIGPHFHSPFWHKPLPLTDFAFWKPVQERR